MSPDTTGDYFGGRLLAKLDAVRAAPALTAHLETLPRCFAYEVITRSVRTATFPRPGYSIVQKGRVLCGLRTPNNPYALRAPGFK